MTAVVAAEVADAEPAAFAAVTVARSRRPTSAVCAVYDEPLAPEIGWQLFPAESHRSHWYVNVIGAVPLQLPLLVESDLPTRAGPVIDGSAVLVGRVAACAVYVAVYVVFAAGAVMLWVAARPSDHDEKA